MLNETPQPLGKLREKVPVVTGGTTGIGLAVAKLFVREGAYVFITGRRQQELDKAVKAIGSNVTGVQDDVAKLADIDRNNNTIAFKDVCGVRIQYDKTSIFLAMSCIILLRLRVMIATACGGNIPHSRMELTA